MAWTTAKKVVSVAASQKGKGNKYLPGQPWCAAFVKYCFKHAGCSSYKPSNPNYVPSVDSWCRKHCKKVSRKSAKAGDIVIFSWGGGSRDHVGLCRGRSGSTLLTWEGNTGTGHYKVAALRRSSGIYAVYRPPYKPEHKVGDTWKENGVTYTMDKKGVWYMKTVMTEYWATFSDNTKKSYPNNYFGLTTGAETDVKRWKAFLNWALGCNLDTSNGTFTKETRERTAQFQEKVGFAIPDGVLGPFTLAKAKTYKRKFKKKTQKKVYI